nr:hypothetical protein [Hymenobacter radiodurans]
MTFATASQSPLLTDLSLAYRLLNPAQITGARRLLLLLHGVGGNELNLLSVGEQLADAQTLVLLVRAPLEFGTGFGFYQVEFSSGKPIFNQAQQLAGQQLLLRFLGEATARYGTPAGQVYLLGFSQGQLWPLIWPWLTLLRYGACWPLAGACSTSRASTMPQHRRCSKYSFSLATAATMTSYLLFTPTRL